VFLTPAACVIQGSREKEGEGEAEVEDAGKTKKCRKHCRLVFIGVGVDRESLEPGFLQCCASCN